MHDVCNHLTVLLGYSRPIALRQNWSSKHRLGTRRTPWFQGAHFSEATSGAVRLTIITSNGKRRYTFQNLHLQI
jgi:hypothetical protein